MSEKESRRLEDMLDNEDKRIHQATGMLSRLFRRILSDQGINTNIWNNLMYTYLDDPRNRVPRHARGRSQTRGNLTKELLKKNMTWGNFEKGIRLLNPVKVVFRIELTWRNGYTTKHEFEINGYDPDTGKKTDLSDGDD